MIAYLGNDFSPNPEFSSTLAKLVFPSSYRLELCWVEVGNVINCSAPVPNSPTPEAVMGTRYVVMSKEELRDSVFNSTGIIDKLSDPVVFEVRLILWRP